MRSGTALAFAVGAWSLLGQFIFNRIIFFYVANSEYTAASIITLHLAGFWLGATWARKRPPAIRVLIAGSAGVTLAAEVLVWRYGILWFGLKELLVLAALCGIGLAAASGALVTRLMGEGSGSHGQRIFMADTAGSVAGALAGGFYVIPFFGIGAALHALLLAQGIALSTSLQNRFSRLAAFITVGALVAALHVCTPAVAASPRLVSVEAMPVSGTSDGERLVYGTHTPFGLLSVTDVRQDASTTLRILRSNSRALCSAVQGDNSGNSQWKVGELPVRMMVPASGRTDLRMASVGLGCGLSVAGALAPSSAGSRVDVIEIDPGMAAAQKFFASMMRPGPDDPRARLVIDDGFRYFAERRGAPAYDVVVIDLAWLQNMNTTHLYSLEMYENVRRNLADDGILAVWTEDGNPLSPVARIVYETLRRVFPNVVVDMSGGMAVFYASPTREDLSNFLPDISQALSDWLAAAPHDAPINTLDNLVMNRFRFNAKGDSDVENIAAKFDEMRSLIRNDKLAK